MGEEGMNGSNANFLSKTDEIPTPTAERLFPVARDWRTEMEIHPSELIDLDRYPISDPESAGYQRMLADVQKALDAEGCAVLKGFLTPKAVALLCKEADSVASEGHKSFNRTNPYFTQGDPALPPNHPVNRFFDRSNAFIPADNFADGAPLRSIFDFPGFDAFIQKALRAEKFHRYADPLADVIVNMAEEGAGFPWHFDTNNFTVTLAIQNAEAGGAFEYAPNTRLGGENFEEVAAILEGRSDRVRVLELEPGDLQLFKGRYSLHRVAPLKGARPRYVAIFSYVEEPGMVATPERCKQLYGRVLPIHYERAGLRADDYID